MPTSDFAVGDVIVVPFPYADRLAEKRRPALVVSNEHLAAEGFIWVAMITSARRAAQAFDIEISDLDRAGLPVPSLIRPTKIACIEPHRVIRRAGAINADRMRQPLDTIRSFIGATRRRAAR